MSTITTHTTGNIPGYVKWLIFLAYACILGIAIAHHELWGDELHSWNITKASASYGDLLAQIRYEGHPPLWYTLMWFLSGCTHNLVYLQLLQYCLACIFIYLLVFHAPFSLLTKLLLPFGYYFLFEYGTLSRNYAGALVLAFALCWFLQRRQGGKPLLIYYLLLLLLSCTHLLGAVLAASIHLYFLLARKEEGSRWPVLLLHLLAGMLVIVPSLYCIFPPSDSEMNMQFWMDKWNRQQLTDIAEAPVKSFIPVPAWWQYHFWNTEVLVTLKKDRSWLKIPVYLLSALLIAVVVALLRKDRKVLSLFLCNLLLTCMVAAIFPLNSARYVGFLFISFIVACWLMRPEYFISWKRKTLNLLVGLQLLAAVVALSYDLRYPFSNAYRVRELAAKVPAGQQMVTDYWCLNNLAAFMDRPFYCIELNRELSFILWDQKMATAMKAATPYTNGLHEYYHQTGSSSVWLLSVNSPQKLESMEPALFRAYTVRPVDSITGAIERYSDLYLYEISLSSTAWKSSGTIPAPSAPL